MVDHAGVHHLAGHPHRADDGAGPAGPVGDHAHPPHPQQHGPAHGVGVQFRHHLVEGRAQATARVPGGLVGVYGHQQAAHQGPHGPLQRLQGDVAGEPVGDHHVHLGGHDVAALHVANPLRLHRDGPFAAVEPVEDLLHEGVALARLLADGQQPHPGALDPEPVAGVHRAHLGELHQPLGAALGVGPGVEQSGGQPGGGGYGGGYGRAADSPDPTHPQEGGGHGRAGVAGRHHGRRPPGADRLGRPHQRRVLHGPHAAAGLGVHRYHLAGRDHLQAAGVAQVLGPADQHHRDAELIGGAPGPGHHLGGAVVGAHGVYGDREHRGALLLEGGGEHSRSAPIRRRSPGDRDTSRSCGRRDGAAWARRSGRRGCGPGPGPARPRPGGCGSWTWTSSSWGQP